MIYKIKFGISNDGKSYLKGIKSNWSECH